MMVNLGKQLQFANLILDAHVRVSFFPANHPYEAAIYIPSVEPLGELPDVYALSPVELDGVLLLVEVEAAALPGEPLEAEQGSAGRRHLKRLQFLFWEMKNPLLRTKRI